MKKVITYGTFDLFHQGHYNILKRAKEQGDYLVVGVTSESYDIERGKLSVRDSLNTRIENVKSTGFVDEVIIEEYLGQKIHDVMKHNIDTLVIGSDWLGKFDHLKSICDVVYLDRTKDISSTQIREENSYIYKIGIATDNLDDKEAIRESKYVSGIHFEGVYSDKVETANEFSNKYELDFFTNKYAELLDRVDFVYINCKLQNRYELIKKAIEEEKHVICETPFSLDIEKHKEIFELVKENKVILIENIITLYLRAFTQFLWMAQGDVVGNNISVKCSLSREDFRQEVTFKDMLTIAISTIIKINGVDYKNIEKSIVTDKNGEITYALITFMYENTVGIIEIGNKININSRLTVIGENATLLADDNWWETGYFELKDNSTRKVKKYSFNFEGTGFRYVLQEIMLLMRDNITENPRLFKEESAKFVETICEIENA